MSLWDLGQIALKLKSEIGARARANMSAGGGDHKNNGAKSGLVNSSNPISPVNTRKEMAQAVGIGEQTMGRIAQMVENAPPVLKDALESKEVSVNRGFKILRAVQQLSPEEQEGVATMMVDAVKGINQMDAEVKQRAKIAGMFSKAYEKAVLLAPTLDNVRYWTECSRMTPEEIEENMKESYELAQVFQTIGDILKNDILPNNWRVKKRSEEQYANSNSPLPRTA